MVKREKLSDRYELLAQLGLARIEVRAGDPAQAREMLNRIVTSGDRYPKIANLARLELGQVLVKEKNYSEAETYFENILKGTKDDPDVIAGASNGLGDCQYAQGKYDEAMYTYSRTYALFLDRADQALRVAHALYYGGRSFRLQAGKESDPAEKARLQKYGTLVMRRAARDFGGTEAGQMAQKEL
jgi:TolA-binding protein